ncbi:hypothetical protein Pla110_42050 [Polystyrenella longa]|uniref:DUF2946 domain-containing protein n=1 Tax=Polystyrenella longa TaxID=2528007 RepID=A0A518CT96_9PLAN|nr:hypothetical protein [Polystyrenella longa]QDU82448.1 hypothetical protein Pla110_42050 [Polystyrenella longa]
MLFRSLFISAFVTVALLGNAGTHAVQEWLGVCTHSHSVVHESTLPSGEHAHCSHGHHSHHHHGQHSCHVPVADDSSVPLQPRPSHDADHCLVCQFFGLSSRVTLQVESPSLFQAVTYAAISDYQQECRRVVVAFNRRGPPTLS